VRWPWVFSPAMSQWAWRRVRSSRHSPHCRRNRCCLPDGRAPSGSRANRSLPRNMSRAGPSAVGRWPRSEPSLDGRIISSMASFLRGPHHRPPPTIRAWRRRQRTWSAWGGAGSAWRGTRASASRRHVPSSRAVGGEEGRVEAAPPLSERPLQLSVPKIPSGLIAARQRSVGYGKRQEIWERVRRSVRTSGLFAPIFLAPRRRKLPGVRLPAT